jgi:uncharacterized protein YyaL (SSP411 family)
MPNLLARETSPYLLQHADNPVHWQAWGEAALAQARGEDKPILLSIGYSTCHWCHVMARESFENAAVADLMNRLFVNIKVDREERPDLDQIYQTALQMLTGRAGGWPLTLFLMPDGTPFFGGTYFPPHARHGLPAFPQVLEQVARAYAQQRDDIEQQNASLLAALARTPPAGDAAVSVAAGTIRQALADIRQGFDPVHGGFSGAPKFPRPAELEFLFWSGDEEARREVLFTLEHMAARGLMDQLGGGFFRYSVDTQWAIPHFEKMLYDNGPLLALYADAWAATGKPLFARAVEGTVAWLGREMTSPEGLFYSALDADSEHEEGRFYVWTPEQVAALLAPEEYRVAEAHWGLDRAPNFEDHAWHLGEERPLESVAQALGMAPDAAERLLESARAKLFAARAGRVRPGRDDKCLTAWNALAIKGLAHAARRCDRRDWLELARRAAAALQRLVWRDGRLAASFQAGQARHNGYLDDYAFLLDALLELAQAGWREGELAGCELAWARELAEALLAHFEDGEAGGFFFTSHDHERLIHRSKPAHDQAMPSGNGIAAVALGRLGHLLEEPRYQAAGERALRAFQAGIADHPAPFPSLLTALREQLAPPGLVILRGPDAALHEWKRAADRVAAPGVLVFALPGDAQNVPASLSRPLSERVQAHVCSGDKCLPEIVQLADLLTILSARTDA